MTKKSQRARDPYAAFLRALRQTPRTWKVLAVLCGGIIRQRPRYECPLEATGWRNHPGLAREHRQAIIAAADFDPGHSPRLRARLLRACGLTEPTR